MTALLELPRWLNAKLSPRWMAKLDRSLAVSSPFVWRARFHWVIYWSFVLSCLALAIAMLGTGPRTSVWTPEPLWTLALLIQLLFMVATSVWAAIVRHVRLPVLRLHTRLAVAALNLVALALLHLPVHAFTLAATYSTARSTSYEQHVDPHLPSVEARLSSIEDSHRLWSLQTGRYYESYSKLVLWWACWTLPLLVGLTFERSQFVLPWVAEMLRMSRRWRLPARLARLDRWLLLRHPTVWSTGVHKFLLYAALVVITVHWVESHAPAFMSGFAPQLMVAGLVLAQIPLFFGRTAPASTHREWRAAVGCYLFAMLFTLGLALTSSKDLRNFVGLVMIELYLLLPMLLLRGYRSSWEYLAPPLLVPVMVLASFLLYGLSWPTVLFNVWLAAFVVYPIAARLSARLSPRWFGATIIGATPALLLGVAYNIVRWLVDLVPQSWPLLSDSVKALLEVSRSPSVQRNDFLTVSLMLAFVYAVYAWAVWPVHNALRRAHAHPRGA